MSRGIMRGSSDICADCQTPDPGWASVNRGVLICDECCGVHRSLGRHVSQVKSLKKGQWCPTQLSMVHQLVALGANSIWEYSLLDPTQNKHGRRKPNPRDQVHPTKADFIRAKYQFLTFMNKQRDSECSSVEDLSQQLHSAVRTGNLETSLRLLSIGADPNYFHPDKGSSCLHVAASLNQPLQVELLLVYGGDPGAYDTNRKTPSDLARLEGYLDISERLVESQYELTDRLAYYLCGRKPDHRCGQHFLIPAMADSSLDLSELAKAAKRKLQALPNHQFEELARDVYDEVDRREIEHIWMSTSHHTHLVMDRQNVPFLPVNPEFSSTRNQGRQKLARFNAREFATLIIDILTDVRRRQCPSGDRATLNLSGKKSMSVISDDEPLYDQVASDDDYASIGDAQSIKDSDPAGLHARTGGEVAQTPGMPNGTANHVTSENVPENKAEQSISSLSSHDSSTAEKVAPSPRQPLANADELIGVKQALNESQARVTNVMQTNRDLRQEIVLLQSMVERLAQENQSLRCSHPQPPPPAPASSSHYPPVPHNIIPGPAGGAVPSARSRPISMFEPREQARAGGANVKSSVMSRNVASQIRASTSSEQTSGAFSSGSAVKLPSNISSKQSSCNSLKSTESVSAIAEESVPSDATATYTKVDLRAKHAAAEGSGEGSMVEPLDSPESDYDNTEDGRGDTDPSSLDAETQLEQARLSGCRSSDGQSSDSLHTLPEDTPPPHTLPSQEEVVKKTERITKKIQELLRNAQDGKCDWFLPSAEKIFSAVNDMVRLFPQTVSEDRIELALQQLTTGADRLRHQCSPGQQDSPSATAADTKLHTQQVIQCAYDIAQAAKQLVMCFE